jgi:hypothetical protein
MYTDGGSIPRIAQVFKGFSPWGYAPAYMIHDWLFVARHCLIDGMDEARFKSVRDVSFDESAQILGEAIQALVQTGRVQQNDLAGATITGAVDSSIAQALWDQKGACAESIVTPEHAAIAERTIPGSSTFARSGEFSTRALPRATAGRKANIVSRITF